nr:MAG TPA: hypothetical protein [Caudoviricetes sp.]
MIGGEGPPRQSRGASRRHCTNFLARNERI